ncbi:MAG: acyl-CoA dehydrogenase family protein [Panacagrimonas sp.]
MRLTRRLMGQGLKALRILAETETVDRAGLRKPAERALYHASRAGFGTVAATGRALRASKKLMRPNRLPNATGLDLFDLRPTEEQQMLQQACRDFALEILRPAAPDADTRSAASQAMIDQAHELGLQEMVIPQRLGGAGEARTAVTQLLITEALAQGDPGLAWACLSSVAVSRALVLWGDADQQSQCLPSLLAGETQASLAILEPGALFDPFHLRTRAHRNDDGFVLSGEKSLVAGAQAADLLIIAAHLEGKGPALFLLRADTAGIALEPQPSMGMRAAAPARLLLNQLRLPASALLGDASAAQYRQCVALSRLAWCGIAIGCGQAVLDLVSEYVNQRTAFGEPISHRQAVAFAVADMALELQGMRLASWRAAALADGDASFAAQAALAHRLCAEKAVMIGNQGVQLLGGHGFTREFPVERWYRDLRAIGLMAGGLLV